MATGKGPLLVIVIVLFIIILILIGALIYYNQNYVPASNCTITPGRFYTDTNTNAQLSNQKITFNDLNEALDYCEAAGDNCPGIWWMPNTSTAIIISNLNNNSNLNSSNQTNSNGIIFIKSPS